MKRAVFGADHEEYRGVVREFVNRDLAPKVADHRAAHSIDRQSWLRAGEQGLLGFFIPEEFGGAGCTDFRFNAVQGEELARLGYAYASAFGINTDIVAPYLLELGTPEQKKRWLPDYAAGRTIAAIAITEPGAGSDVLGIRTTATRVDSGWLLSGAKTFITNGSSADLIVVAAKIEEAKPGHAVPARRMPDHAGCRVGVRRPVPRGTCGRRTHPGRCSQGKVDRHRVPEQGHRPLPAITRRLRLHAGIQHRTCVAGRPCHPDLRRHQ